MVTHLCANRVRLGLQVVNLSNTKFDLVQSFAQLVLTFLLLPIEDSVDLGLHLLRLLDERAEELIPLLQLDLRLILVHPQLLFGLSIALVALLHVLVRPAKPLLILVHAELERLLELGLLGEERPVVDLLDGAPFLTQLPLHLNDHVVTVPLAAVLYVLDKSVSDLANLDARENLRHLGFLNPVPPLLKVFERFVQSFLLELRVRQL